MKPDTSKATARPWRIDCGVDGIPYLVGADRIIARVLQAGADDPQADADMRLLRERVNGWDALVAERDRLREALRVLVNLSGHPYFPAVSGDLPAWAGAIQEAREAVKGGAS